MKLENLGFAFGDLTRMDHDNCDEDDYVGFDFIENDVTTKFECDD